MNQPATALASAPLNEEIAGNDNVPDVAMTWKGIDFTAAEVADPTTISDEKEALIVDKLCGNLYYTEYYDHQRSPYDLKFSHKLAEAIIGAKKRGESAEQGLEESGEFSNGGGDDGLWSEADSEVEDFISDLRDAREEMEEDENNQVIINTDWDENETKESLRDAAIDQTMSKDDSSITDLIGSYDHFEIGFILSPSDSVEDDCISSTKNWADWSALQINDGLVGALARMGYSLKEYRAHSGNREKIHAKRRHKVWPNQLATLDQIKSLVDDACSSQFIFMIYAQVSLADLVKVNLNQPLVLDQYALSTYNSWNGTFFDISFKSPIVIDPKRAFLHLPGEGYSPDSICGLVGSYYTADLKN